MARVTIADLAREAGVSLATVDRVLNGRLKVREETALKVHEAAQRIGYHGANAIRSRILADLPELHVGVILQKERHAFYRDFARQIESRVARVTSYRMRATIRFAETTCPANWRTSCGRCRARCRPSRPRGLTTTRSRPRWPT